MVCSAGFYVGIVNMVLALLLFFPFALTFFDFIFRLLYLVVVVFPRRPDKIDTRGDESVGFRFLILIVAHNEERIIAQTLESLLMYTVDFPSAELILLADNCADETAGISAKMGVKTYLRTDGELGKGKALSWFVNSASKDLLQYDLVAILDADTLIAADFCERVSAAFIDKNVQAVQSSVQPIYSDNFTTSVLAAYSEILSQKIDDDVRSRLGWTVPLRGTGMVFRREMFSRICIGLETQVDDIELSIRLARIGITVSFAPEAIVYDPKSSNMLDLARQRGRWLKGQRQIFSLMMDDLMKLITSGFSGWSLMQALLFKPKTLLLIIKLFLILALSYFTIGPLFYILEISLFVSILIDLLYYFMGLKYVSQPKVYLLALLKTPLYFVLWFTSWFFSIVPGKKWLRARDE